MPDTAQEKTEEATQRRRTEARKRGTVARSSDLTSAIVMIAMTLALPGIMVGLSSNMLQGLHWSIEHLPTDASPASMSSYTLRFLGGVAPGVCIMMFGAMIVGLASNFAQVGIKLSPEAMIPNFGKLNPFAGIKRLFSLQLGVEGLKALVKSVLFGYLAFSVIVSNWGPIGTSWKLAPFQTLSLVGSILHTITVKVVVAWLVLAGLDYFFQRKQTSKQMRMTKEEVKQEMKDTEQSPELRAARARRRRKIRASMKKAVKFSDVVVTNPTHFAVALQYEQSKGSAPIVTAKGADFLAARIREEAKLNGVPIVENPPLARALYKQCEVGDAIPRELFQAVAELLAYVYKTLRRVKVG